MKFVKGYKPQPRTKEQKEKDAKEFAAFMSGTEVMYDDTEDDDWDDDLIEKVKLTGDNSKDFKNIAKAVDKVTRK